VADPSTLRRWLRKPDSFQPPFSCLRRTMLAISAWLDRTEILVHDSLPLRWRSTASEISSQATKIYVREVVEEEPA
jgi:hypothetical protein